MTTSSDAPTVVALVPAWRSATFIRQTLDGLAAQTYPRLEILISDDASPDETAQTCEEYAARDHRFRLIRQPRNLGWVGNVNALLREARGDYFFFAFHDDVPAPDYVARCVAALETNPQAINAFSDVTLVHQDGSREERRYDVLEGVTSRTLRARWVAQRRGSWWVPNRGVFRASAARSIGGLRRHLAGEFTADWPWLLHMSLLGEFVRVPEILVTKIYTPQSLSRGWKKGIWPSMAVAFSACREVARARVPVRAKLGVSGDLAYYFWRLLREAIGRVLRRLGLRR